MAANLQEPATISPDAIQTLDIFTKYSRARRLALVLWAARVVATLRQSAPGG
jgi:hypothetical protein